MSEAAEVKPRRRAEAAEEVDGPAAATAAPTTTGRRARAQAADEVETPSAAAAPVAGRRAARAPAAEEANVAAPTHADPNTAPAAAPTRTTRRVAAAAATDDSTGASAPSSNAPAHVQADYDSMTYDEFLANLRQRSKKDVMAALQARSGPSEGKKSENEEEPFTDGSGGYSYSDLLKRVYDELRSKNPSLSGTSASRNQIPVPQIEKYGSKKTAVANFKAICDAIQRTMEEVKDYLDKELSTTGSIDSSNCLILKLQNVKSIQFEGMIIKYVDEFVKCHACKKINSTLQKEDRIMVLKCNVCHASRTVTAGGNAFHAVTGKRSKLRAANAL